MWASLCEYHRPATIGAALKILARMSPRTVPLAGGTWLVAKRDPFIQAVVDLSGLDLAFVVQSARLMRLGAMTTLHTLVEHPLVREVGCGLLAKASRRSAPLSIRNIATLGGTLAIGGATSEVLLALLVLDARAVIRSPLKHEVTMDALLANRSMHLPPQALITEVYLPKLPPGSGAALVEISRTPRGSPIVNAAAVITRRGQTCRGVRLALGGVAPYPIRLSGVEGMFSYQPFRDGLLARSSKAVSDTINPSDDFLAGAEYRRVMAAVVAEGALREAWEQATKE